MKKTILSLSFLLGLSLLGACSGGHNPDFNCKGFGCSDDGAGSGTTPIAAPLSFTKTLEQGYWYSRYNLSSLVMKSGNGETFMPDMSMVQQMVEMVSDDLSTARPPQNPALIKRVFNSGNPQYKTASDSNPMDFSDERWLEVESEKTTGASFGWTLMKEVEWSRLFNVDAHFGKPGENDVPGAQQRFSGLVLCAQSLMQTDDFIQDRQGDRVSYDLSDKSGSYVSFGAIANFADYLNTQSIDGLMENNRCAQVAAMMKGKPAQQIATDYTNFLMDMEFELLPPETLKEKSLFIQAYGFYSKALSDRSVYEFGAQPVANELKEIDYSEIENPVKLSYGIRALLDAYRITQDVSFSEKATEAWEVLKEDFNLETKKFKSLNAYSSDDLAVIFSALNALKHYAGDDVEMFYVLEAFIKGFEGLVNQSGMQLSAPPFEAIPEWERKQENLHRAEQLPTPRQANGANGVAPVFSSTIEFDESAQNWSAQNDRYETAGAMHLANQMVWFHSSEVSGFVCPDDNCAEVNQLSSDDLVPPGSSSGDDNDDGDVDSRPILTFDELHSQILTRCIACHAGGGAPMGLDMSSPDRAYNNLVGVAAGQGGAFGGVDRVSPGDSSPQSSYIIAKLQESSENRIGDRMPRGGPFLSEEEIQQVKDWIDAGARR